MVNRLILLASVIAAAIITVMLFFTSPSEIGPFGVFVFFMMVYLVMLGVMTVAVKIFMRTVQRRRTMRTKDYAYAALLAFWPLVILMLISTGTTNIVFSILGVTGVVAIGMFVISKFMKA